ncbi:MAG: phosphodiester glycosidase family protein [Oscillospiraceae bacterium]|nr:phosphodiester glycosidase family protein [Oscillospiraceae bacterium]
MRTKTLSVILTLVMLLQLLPLTTLAATAPREEKASALAAPVDKKIQSQKDYTITTGVTESHIVLTDTAGANPIAGFMATISPTAKVTFKASFPNYYTSGSTTSTRASKAKTLAFGAKKMTAQAADYTKTTGENVLFATNADFFNMDINQPRGCLILEGNLIQRPDVDDAEAYFAVLKDGTFDIRAYNEPYHDVQEAASGKQWLVKNGKTVKNNDEVLAPRNAIGLKADGTCITFVADGRQSHTVGMTLMELAELMYAAGCVEAINLDGGGSAVYASRRNTTGALTIRNSPSDATGERPVTTGLLLVATDCRHSYDNTYAPTIDNSHYRICTQCSAKSRVPHTYKNGKCVCGATEPGNGELYFGFDNDALDRPHYYSSAYQYTNFDIHTHSTWVRGFWSTTYNGSTKAFTINNTSGELIMDVTDGYSGSTANGNLMYGPWLRTTNRYGVYPGNTEEDAKYHALSYDPSQAQFLRIRFKLTNCVTDTGKEPRVVLAYHYKKDGVFGYATDVSAAYSYTDGVYQTLTIPLTSQFKNADVIINIAFRFQHIYSSSGGKLAIDYIYFGKERENSLFFDFKADTASRLRYADPVYEYRNYDYKSYLHWASHYNGGADKLAIDNTAGVISVDVTEGYSGSVANGNVIYGPWLKTTRSSGTLTGQTTNDIYPLAYVPNDTDYFQIRFKTTDCVADTGKTPRVVLEYYYIQDGVRAYANDIRATWTVVDDQYVTLTAPATAKFKGIDIMECFGLRFQHIKSSNGGKLVVDYIYIGPRSGLPSVDYTVKFQNWDGSLLQSVGVLKGETATYSGAAPTRAYDESCHYSFKGWDQSLSNITSNLTVTAQYNATAHSFTYTTADGSKHTARCACGYSKSEAHTWDKGTLSTQPTCTAEGLRTYTCTACKTTKTEAVSPKGHTAVTDAAVAPTCTAEGKTEGSHCSACGAVIKAQTSVPPTGHQYVYTIKNASFHIVGCKSCDLRTEEAHSYKEGYCVCGEPEIKEPILGTDLKINHTLNLASDISVNLVVAKSLLTGFDLSTVYMLAEVEAYEGNDLIGTSTLKLLPVEQGNYYYFTLNGLTAVQMNDRISSVLYGTKDGQPYCSPVDEYSIGTYAYSQLNKDGAEQELKNLCSELLRYGSCAQIFKSYRTDALVDAAMTQTHRSYLSNMDDLTFGSTNTVLNDLQQPTVAWAGKSLNLESKVAVKYVFRLDGYTGELQDLNLRVRYEGINGQQLTATVRDAELYQPEGQLYAFSFDGLLAAELRCVLSAQIYAGDTPVSCTLQYSPDTYGANKTGALGTLCKAIFAYSDSAKTYFQS